jgi:hypothetical protein
MIRIVGRNIIRFLMLILFQVLVLDNIQMGGYLNQYFYVLFIILMPFETPRWLMLITAFLLGVSVDLFTNTLGMHAAASVFMAFLRPWILSIFAPRDGYESDTFPRIFYYGFNWFLKYALVMVFVHHLALFYIEVFHFQDFLSTFLRVILSTLVTTASVILSQYFIYRK